MDDEQKRDNKEIKLYNFIIYELCWSAVLNYINKYSIQLWSYCNVLMYYKYELFE